MNVMSANSEISPIDRIHTTLDIRDPDRRTVCIGSAAIAANFATVGDESIPIYDVDVLCSEEHFLGLAAQSLHFNDAARVQLRWPREELRALGATEQVIDINPSNEAMSRGVLPYSACVKMNFLYPISYDDIIGEDGRVITACGIRCIRVSEVLRWLAILGRLKDVEKVDELLPLAYDAGLVTIDERSTILKERQVTLEARRLHPGSYFGRLPFTADPNLFTAVP